MSSDGPLSPPEARRLIRRLIAHGSTFYTKHALVEMEKDDLTREDCIGVLRGGTILPAEFEAGAWRYRCRTNRVCIVCELGDEAVVVVTAWRSRT